MIRCMAGSFNMLGAWWRHSSEDTVLTPDGLGRSRRTFRCVGPTSNGYCRNLTASSDRMIQWLPSGDHRTIRCLELFPATFKRLVRVGEAYLSGLCSFIVTLLAILKYGRPILVPRQVKSSML